MGIGCRFSRGRKLTCSRSHVNSTGISQNHETLGDPCWRKATIPLHDRTIKNEPHALQKLLERWQIRAWRENCRCMQPPAKDDEVGRQFEKRTPWISLSLSFLPSTPSCPEPNWH